MAHLRTHTHIQTHTRVRTTHLFLSIFIHLPIVIVSQKCYIFIPLFGQSLPAELTASGGPMAYTLTPPKTEVVQSVIQRRSTHLYLCGDTSVAVFPSARHAQQNASRPHLRYMHLLRFSGIRDNHQSIKLHLACLTIEMIKIVRHTP